MTKFNINNVEKLSDKLETQAYEWVLLDIQEYFGTETRDTETLTKEQIGELEQFMETADYIEGYCAMVLRYIIDNWYDENHPIGDL